MPVPSVRRRLAAAVYEGVLLFGVVFISGYLYSSLTQYRGSPDSLLRYGFQLTIFGAVGLYFVWCWKKSGQTLPMKTWKFRLVAADGGRLTNLRCWARYALAWLGPLTGVGAYKLIVTASHYGTARFSLLAFTLASPLFALNLLWALRDDERQFLHDRLAGTRLVSA
jgi:uncharacterized RDD family membrane protein YckC